MLALIESGPAPNNERGLILALATQYAGDV